MPTRKGEGSAQKVLKRGWRVKVRDGFTCQNCNKVFTYEELEADHIVPLHKGGSNSMENMQTLCIECHKRKTAQECTVRTKTQTGLDGWPVE